MFARSCFSFDSRVTVCFQSANDETQRRGVASRRLRHRPSRSLAAGTRASRQKRVGSCAEETSGLVAKQNVLNFVFSNFCLLFQGCVPCAASIAAVQSYLRNILRIFGFSYAQKKARAMDQHYQEYSYLCLVGRGNLAICRRFQINVESDELLNDVIETSVDFRHKIRAMALHLGERSLLFSVSYCSSFVMGHCDLLADKNRDDVSAVKAQVLDECDAARERFRTTGIFIQVSWRHLRKTRLLPDSQHRMPMF